MAARPQEALGIEAREQSFMTREKSGLGASCELLDASRQVNNWQPATGKLAAGNWQTGRWSLPVGA